MRVWQWRHYPSCWVGHIPTITCALIYIPFDIWCHRSNLFAPQYMENRKCHRCFPSARMADFRQHHNRIWLAHTRCTWDEQLMSRELEIITCWFKLIQLLIYTLFVSCASGMSKQDIWLTQGLRTTGKKIQSRSAYGTSCLSAQSYPKP